MDHPFDSGATRDLPVRLSCRRCRTDSTVADLERTRPGDDPLVTFECPGCGALLDIGTHAW